MTWTKFCPAAMLLNLLRIQFERQSARPFPSIHEYAALYAMNAERMRRAKDDILIMAPGAHQPRRRDHAGGRRWTAQRHFATGDQRHRGPDGGVVPDRVGGPSRLRCGEVKIWRIRNWQTNILPIRRPHDRPGIDSPGGE